MRLITIKPCLNGWIVEVGCQVVVFTEAHKMLDEIGKYIDDPLKVEQEYIDNCPNPIIKAEANMLDRPTALENYGIRNEVLNRLNSALSYMSPEEPVAQPESTDGTP